VKPASYCLAKPPPHATAYPKRPPAPSAKVRSNRTFLTNNGAFCQGKFSLLVEKCPKNAFRTRFTVQKPHKNTPKNSISQTPYPIPYSGCRPAHPDYFSHVFEKTASDNGAIETIEILNTSSVPLPLHRFFIHHSSFVIDRLCPFRSSGQSEIRNPKSEIKTVPASRCRHYSSFSQAFAPVCQPNPPCSTKSPPSLPLLPKRHVETAKRNRVWYGRCPNRSFP